jgi:hypothetical protein
VPAQFENPIVLAALVTGASGTVIATVNGLVQIVCTSGPRHSPGLTG